MTGSEALAYIHSVSWLGSKPGLSRTRALLAAIGDPQDTLRFVHVAGTNGKGSTCAMTERILREAGYRTGLYTSPYITHFSERMQVCGKPIPEETFAALVEELRPYAEAMEDTPTEFELVTALAFTFFAREHCHIVVLECGMGGELDSTNVIRVPECAALCTIGLDHMEYLGSTLPEIARTKAGILKDGGTCVTYPAVPEVEALYEAVAKERHLDRHRADFSRLHPISHSLEGQSFLFDGFGRLNLSLLGKNQLHNAAMALTIVECLRAKGWTIPQSAVEAGLSLVEWPGRFEVLGRSPTVLADGGHNPECLLALRENLLTYVPGMDLVAIVGVMADKDYRAMFLPVLPLIRRWIAVTPDNPRALPADRLAETLGSFGADAVACENIAQGVTLAKRLCRKDGGIVCFGSLYLLGELRQRFGAESDFSPLNPS